MAYDIHAASLAAPEPLTLPPPGDWQTTLFNATLISQQLQFETALAWQRSALALAQEWWDLWCCHCAGGAPIDA